MNVKIYLQSTPTRPAGEGRGEEGNTNFEYLENEKNFLDDIQSSFHKF